MLAEVGISHDLDNDVFLVLYSIASNERQVMLQQDCSEACLFCPKNSAFQSFDVGMSHRASRLSSKLEVPFSGCVDILVDLEMPLTFGK